MAEATTNKYARIDFGTAEAVFNKLGGVEGIKRFLGGDVEVVIKSHIIDCDAAPFVPEGWSVEEHRKGGQLRFDPEKVTLHLSSNQQGWKIVEGNKLRKELAKMLVMNANVLDFLLAHPELIPESWKKDGEGNTRYIFFWGTIYRHSDGDLCVRFLYWLGDGWIWGCRWLDDGFSGGDPAAVSQVSA